MCVREKLTGFTTLTFFSLIPNFIQATWYSHALVNFLKKGVELNFLGHIEHFETFRAKIILWRMSRKFRGKKNIQLFTLIENQLFWYQNSS